MFGGDSKSEPASLVDVKELHAKIGELTLVHSLMPIVLGIWITGDDMTWSMALGGALTLNGVYIVAVRSGRRSIDLSDPLVIAEQVS